MTVRIALRAAASRDLADAYAWYEARQRGLGVAFLDRVEAVFTRIAEKPLGYPVVRGDARRALVPRFPYSIYYRIRAEEIRIVGVIHQNRDPRTWQGRLR